VEKYLEITFDTGVSPIHGRFRDVRIKEKAKTAIYKATGLDLDMETCRIGSLELVISIEAMLEGEMLDEEALMPWEGAESYSCSKEKGFCCVTLGMLAITAPGIQLSMRDLRIVATDHNYHKWVSEQARQDKEAHGQDEPEPAAAADEPGRANTWLEGRFAHVLSNWVLKSAEARLEEFKTFVNLSQFPFIGQAACFIDELRIANAGFTGNQKVHYEAMNRTDKAGALDYHLSHFPFDLTVRNSSTSLYDSSSPVKSFDPSHLLATVEVHAPEGHDAIWINVRHDDWRQLHVEGSVWSIVVLGRDSKLSANRRSRFRDSEESTPAGSFNAASERGKKMHRLISVCDQDSGANDPELKRGDHRGAGLRPPQHGRAARTPGTTGPKRDHNGKCSVCGAVPWVAFRFCNILDEIEDNCKVIRRCYRLPWEKKRLAEVIKRGSDAAEAMLLESTLADRDIPLEEPSLGEHGQMISLALCELEQSQIHEKMFAAQLTLDSLRLDVLLVPPVVMQILHYWSASFGPVSEPVHPASPGADSTPNSQPESSGEVPEQAPEEATTAHGPVLGIQLDVNFPLPRILIPGTPGSNDFVSKYVTQTGSHDADTLGFLLGDLGHLSIQCPARKRGVKGSAGLEDIPDPSQNEILFRWQPGPGIVAMYVRDVERPNHVDSGMPEPSCETPNDLLLERCGASLGIDASRFVKAGDGISHGSFLTFNVKWYASPLCSMVQLDGLEKLIVDVHSDEGFFMKSQAWDMFLGRILEQIESIKHALWPHTRKDDSNVVKRFLRTAQNFRKWVKNANNGLSTRLCMKCHFSVGGHFYDSPSVDEIISHLTPSSRSRMKSRTQNLHSGFRTSSVVHGVEKMHGLELYAPVTLEMEGDTVQIVCQKGECAFNMAAMGSVLRFVDFISFGYFNLDALNRYQHERGRAQDQDQGTVVHAEVPSPACRGSPAGDANASTSLVILEGEVDGITTGA